MGVHLRIAVGGVENGGFEVGFGESAGSCWSTMTAEQRQVDLHHENATEPMSMSLERFLHHLNVLRDIAALIEAQFHLSTLLRQTYVALWEMSAHVLSTFNPESSSAVAVFAPLFSVSARARGNEGGGEEKGLGWHDYYRAGRDVVLAVLYTVVLVHVLFFVAWVGRGTGTVLGAVWRVVMAVLWVLRCVGRG